MPLPSHICLTNTTMRTLFTFLLQLLFICGFAQDCYRAHWVDSYDGSQAQEFFIDVDRHPEGGFVVLGKHGLDGTTLGNQTINPGVASYYLARMDSAGNFSQLTAILPQGGITLKRIAVLPDGSVAAGCTIGSNLTLGTETFHIHGGAKPLLVMFDTQFNYTWHLASENTSNSSDVRDIHCDSEGNIFWGGLFSGDYLSFGEDTYLHRVTDGGAWLSKVNNQGQMQWLRGIAPGVSAGLQTVTVDSNDDVWISGQATVNANGSLKFSDQVIAPGYLNSAFCVYVAKYDSNGDCIWGKISSSTSSFGSIYTADAMADDQGNMYICGQLTGTYEWSGMPMVGGDGSGFLWSIDTNGNGLWFKTMGGQGSSESATNLDVRADRIAVIGALSSNQPYVGDFPVYSLASGTYKAFNAQFYTNGELEFCRMNQSDTQNFFQHDVVIDEGNNQLVLGYYKGTNISWYPINLTHNGTNPKKFVAKFGPSAPTTFTITAGPDKTTTCGTNVQLNGATTPSSGVGFGWWPDMGFSNNFSKTPNANTTEPKSYVFYGHYQGCIKRDTVQVFLSNYNNLNVEAGIDQVMCIGDTVALSAVATDPAATIAWTPNYRLTSNTSINTNCFTNTSLNYVVEATVGNCKARDTVYVKVNRKPTIVLPYQTFYISYQMHTCLDQPILADLGSNDNTYSFSNEANITWQNDHSVVFGTDAPYYGGNITAVSPEGCENELTYTVYVYDYQPGPPILNQPSDTIYLCPASGYVHEEEFMITSDIPYLPEEFNFSWYSGWQVDELDGLGWRDIEIWNYGHYELFPNSVGFPTSAYYVPLRFWNVEPEMDGFRYRAYINDLCSPRVYTEQMVLRVGPAFTDQTTALNVCQGASDTLYVEAANNNGLYQWQVFRDNVWMDILVDETHFQTLGNQLIVLNATAGMDSLFRCRIQGCSPAQFSYSDAIPVTVQSNEINITGPFQSQGCLGESISLHVNATGGSFEIQWLRNGLALNSNSVGYTGINNDTLFINTSQYNPQGQTYSCQLFNTQCGQAFTSDTWTIDVPTPITIDWEVSTLDLCVNDEEIFISSAMPEGGAYSGDGLIADYFDPAYLSQGSYPISYTYFDNLTGCTSTATRTIHVWALPTVQLQLSQTQACINSENNSVEVIAQPSGGSISAPGLTFDSENSNFILPEAAGSYTIEFTYTSEHGCTNVTNQTFIALDTTTISWVDDLGIFCIENASAPITMPLPEGGTFLDFEVSENNLELDELSAGTYTLTYSFTAANSCTSTQNSTFQIAEIIVQWTDSLLAGCISGDLIDLGNPTPAGGTFVNIAVTDHYLDPLIAGIGFHEVTYEYTDATTGCMGSAIQYVQVYDQPDVTISGIDENFCEGNDLVVLDGGSPSGGSYTGDGVQEINPGEFGLALDNLSPGDYSIVYHFIDDSGCSNEASTSFVVHQNPSIEWANDLGSFCTNDEVVVVAEPQPIGGTFNQDWAIAGALNLVGLGSGAYDVLYMLVDDYGCTSIDTASFMINDTLEVVWTAPSPGEPNDGFFFCGNFFVDSQTEMTNYASPVGGDFYFMDDYLENNTWHWGEFFEPNLYPISYVVTDPETGCVTTSTQIFELDICGSVNDEAELQSFCWSDGKQQLWLSSAAAGNYEVINSAGQVVLSGSLFGGVQTITPHLAAGIYLVKMQIGTELSYDKVLIGY
jgi:hypothetical protein